MILFQLTQGPVQQQVAVGLPVPSPVEQCKMQYLDPGTRFVGLTLSGGGARAAVFSAATIFELADLGLMEEVDVISGASGGALTAGYYALTCDNPDRDDCTTSRGRERRTWKNRDEVLYNRLSRDFILKIPSVAARTISSGQNNFHSL